MGGVDSNKLRCAITRRRGMGVLAHVWDLPISTRVRETDSPERSDVFFGENRLEVDRFAPGYWLIESSRVL